MEVVIDAKKGIFGRICSFAAKEALAGKEVYVVNSEKAVITGNQKNSIETYQKRRDKGGHSRKGPRYSKSSYMLFKRGIRGMLPDHRKGYGKIAFGRVKCYDGVPKELEQKKMITLSKPKNNKYSTVQEIVGKL